MASAAGIRAGKAFVELTVQEQEVFQKLRKVENSVRDFVRNIEQTAGTISFAGIAGLTGLGSVVKNYADFDDQMRLAAAVSGATGDSFQALTNKAKELGRTTSWTASQVASGMVSLGKMGFNSGEIHQAITGVMDLARATGTEIPDATDIAGNTLRQFGLEAAQMERVCNILVATANGSAQSLTELGDSMKYAAPVARTVNLSLEDTSLLLGQLANFGIKGSMAGTSIRNMMTQLSSSDIQDFLKNELNVVTTDAEGNLRNLVDIVGDLGKAIAGMPNAEQLGTIEKIFGKRPLAAALSLSVSNFDSMREAIYGAGSAAADTAKKMDAGLGGAIRITLSALEALGNEVGEQLSPMLIKWGQSLQSLAETLQNVASTSGPMLQNIVAMGTGFVGVSTVVYALSKAFDITITSFKNLTTVFQGSITLLNKFTGYAKAAKAADEALIVAEQKRAILANAGDARVAAEAKLVAAQLASKAAVKSGVEAEIALAASRVKAAEAAVAEATATLDVAYAESQEAASANVAAQAELARAAALRKTILAAAAVAVALTALIATFKTVDYFQSKAAKNAEKANEGTEKAYQKQDKALQELVEDQEKMNRLKELSEKQSLTNGEFKEAETLVSSLTRKYADLGITCDKASQKIDGMADAQTNFNNAVSLEKQKAAQAKLDSLRNEEAALLEESHKYAFNRNDASWIDKGWLNAKSIFGGKSWEEEKKLNLERQAEIRKEIAKTQEEIDLLKAARLDIQGQAKVTDIGMSAEERQELEQETAQFEKDIFENYKDDVQKIAEAVDNAFTKYSEAIRAMFDDDKKKFEKENPYPKQSEAFTELDSALNATEGLADRLKLINDTINDSEKFGELSKNKKELDFVLRMKKTYENLLKAEEWASNKKGQSSEKAEYTKAILAENQRLSKARIKYNQGETSKDALQNAEKNALNNQINAAKSFIEKAEERLKTLDENDVAGRNAINADIDRAYSDMERFTRSLADLEKEETEKAIKTAKGLTGPTSGSSGTFNAFEAMDMQYDWERQEMQKQTSYLRKIYEEEKKQNEKEEDNGDAL